MKPVTLDFLTEQLAVGDLLRSGRDKMFDPQDLPGRYGRVVGAIDRVLQATGCEAVVGGGWAVWRHGYVARLTQDIDIVLPAGRIDEFLRVALVAGFELLQQPEGRWPKLRHQETNIEVDILPEGGRPGTSTRPAPTTIPHPGQMGAQAGVLRYIEFPRLIELKLAAGRGRDESDVIELVRANPDQIETIRNHLVNVHADYVIAFNRLMERARDQRDE
jgi:hypothetical protein